MHTYIGMFLYTHECVILMHEATRRSKTTNRTYAKSVPKYLQLQTIKRRVARRADLAVKTRSVCIHVVQTGPLLWDYKYLLLHQENYVM